MVVPESTLGGLSGKNNFDRGKLVWNVKFNDKNQRKLILLWFWAIIFRLVNKMIFRNSYFLNDINSSYHNNDGKQNDIQEYLFSKRYQLKLPQ